MHRFWMIYCVAALSGSGHVMACILPEDGLVSHWRFKKDGTDSWGTRPGVKIGTPDFEAGVDELTMRIDREENEGYTVVSRQTLDFTDAHETSYLGGRRTILGPKVVDLFITSSRPVVRSQWAFRETTGSFSTKLIGANGIKPGSTHQLNDGHWHRGMGGGNGTVARLYAAGALMDDAPQTGHLHEGGDSRTSENSFSGLLDEVVVYFAAGVECVPILAP